MTQKQKHVTEKSAEWQQVDYRKVQAVQVLAGYTEKDGQNFLANEKEQAGCPALTD